MYLSHQSVRERESWQILTAVSQDTSANCPNCLGVQNSLEKTSGLETNKSKVCSCFGYHFFDCTDHDFLLIFQQLIPAQGSETHRARLKVVIGSFTFHCWHQVWYILQVLQSIAYSKYIYIYILEYLGYMQVRSLNLIPPCLWNDIISFLFWHAFSAIKILALWKPPKSP